MSASPFTVQLGPPFLMEILAIYLIGPVIWGYVCGRLRLRVLGVLLLFLPPLPFIVIWPDLLNHLDVLFFPYLPLTMIGYIIGFFWSRRSKTGKAAIASASSALSHARALKSCCPHSEWQCYKLSCHH
jgi:ABC-type polysaccharide/polyol phosphate export permease